jgi:hypothetical protein
MDCPTDTELLSCPEGMVLADESCQCDQCHQRWLPFTLDGTTLAVPYRQQGHVPHACTESHITFSLQLRLHIRMPCSVTFTFP